jgi:DNA ligase D-like protein (predicted 3'-phosphoesterase)
MHKILLICLSLFFVQGCKMPVRKSLKKYEEKRNFCSTLEPTSKLKKKKVGKDPVFVIHKHAARNMHFDFRIEVDGVLKSWAVPKGVSTDPGEKHLAIPTEDHPYEYKDFEGTIPPGNYGAGTVMIWDTGTYKNIKTKDGEIVPIDKCIRNGRIEIFLKGKKLHGGYALIRAGTKDRKFWLLLKMDDEYVDRSNKIGKEKAKSAVSGRTMEEIALSAE